MATTGEIIIANFRAGLASGLEQGARSLQELPSQDNALDLVGALVDLSAFRGGDRLPAAALAAAPNPTSYGQLVTFTATVSPIGGGTVAFSADGR